MSEPLFAVAYFRRVFEVVPARDVVTLTQLSSGLTQFLLKTKVAKAVAREKRKIEKAWQAQRDGQPLPSRLGRAISRHVQTGGLPAGEKAVQKLLKRAKARAKTDLRLWSPAHYTKAGRREKENVLALSCLVLDFDDGSDPEEMSARFADHYHIVHSTWSHGPELPKYRLCLPLKRPVHSKDWALVWNVGRQRAAELNDPAGKSTSSTFALPASPRLDAERIGFVREAPLWDPVGMGLAAEGQAPAELTPLAESYFRGTSGERTLPPSQPPKVNVADFDLFGPPDEDSAWDDEFDNMF